MKPNLLFVSAAAAAVLFVSGCASSSEIVYDEQDAGIEYTNLEVKMLDEESDLYLYSTNSEEHPFAVFYKNDDNFDDDVENSRVIPWLIFLSENDLTDVADKLDMLVSESDAPILLRKVSMKDKNNGIVFQRNIDEGDTVYSLIKYQSRLVNMGTAKEPKWEVKYVELGHYPTKADKITAFAKILRKAAGADVSEPAAEEEETPAESEAEDVITEE